MFSTRIRLNLNKIATQYKCAQNKIKYQSKIIPMRLITKKSPNRIIKRSYASDSGQPPRNDNKYKILALILGSYFVYINH